MPLKSSKMCANQLFKKVMPIVSAIMCTIFARLYQIYIKVLYWQCPRQDKKITADQKELLLPFCR